MLFSINSKYKSASITSLLKVLKCLHLPLVSYSNCIRCFLVGHGHWVPANMPAINSHHSCFPLAHTPSVPKSRPASSVSSFSHTILNLSSSNMAGSLKLSIFLFCLKPFTFCPSLADFHSFFRLIFSD